MRTDGVVLGTLKQCGNHTHLEWVCPDCGNQGCKGYAPGDIPHRIVCSTSGREFLVLGGVAPTRQEAGGLVQHHALPRTVVLQRPLHGFHDNAWM